MLAARVGKRRTEYVEDYVVFDLETTGISCAADQVVEISAVEVQKGQVVDEFSTLVNPLMHIPRQASLVNGITDGMVKESPLFQDALTRFLEFARDSVLVGHNIHSFDMKFLYRDAKRFWNQTIGNDYIDTLQLSRICLPQLRHHRLVDLAEHYGISPEDAHRALNDCCMNQQVFEFLGKEPVLSGRTSCSGEKTRTCPRCGSPLKKRSGRYGVFYCCGGYPVCRYKCASVKFL